MDGLMDGQINLLVLICKNIFCEIKFLICVHEITSMKFAILEAEFANIFSKKYTLQAIVNLTNGKDSYIQKHRKFYLIVAFSTCYFYMICSNNVLE